MRVEYTLPGFLPATEAPEEIQQGEGVFSKLLTAPPAARLPSWEDLLRLTPAPVTAASIGPPTKPVNTGTLDAPASRLQWKQMLDRQTSMFASLSARSQDAAGQPDLQALRRMLAVLLGYQEMQDAVSARSLADTEG